MSIKPVIASISHFSYEGAERFTEPSSSGIYIKKDPCSVSGVTFSVILYYSHDTHHHSMGGCNNNNNKSVQQGCPFVVQLLV